jgi:hypothetical protein
MVTLLVTVQLRLPSRLGARPAPVGPGPDRQQGGPVQTATRGRALVQKEVADRLFGRETGDIGEPARQASPVGAERRREPAQNDDGSAV